MAEDTKRTKVDDELEALLNGAGKSCKYAQEVSGDVKAAIRHKVETGNKKERVAWTAFVTLCKNHGADVSVDLVSRHFKSGHDDDR